MFSFEDSRYAEDDTECGEESGHIICLKSEPFYRNGTLDRGLDTKHSVFVVLLTMELSAPGPYFIQTSFFHKITL